MFLKRAFRHASVSVFKTRVFARLRSWGTPLLESRGERILFRPSWKMWRIFREISCGHVSWKLKGENLQNFSPKFRRSFRLCRRKISPEFRSREFPSQDTLVFLKRAVLFRHASVSVFKTRVFWAGKKPINRKTHKQNLHRIVPGLSRPFPQISWEFCLCVSLFP